MQSEQMQDSPWEDQQQEALKRNGQDGLLE